MYDASIQKAIGSRRFGTVSLCIENESLYPWIMDHAIHMPTGKFNLVKNSTGFFLKK